MSAWLYLIIIGGTFGLIGLMLMSQEPRRIGYHPLPPHLMWAIAGCIVVSMGCAGGMFLLKRWGFYGYVLAQLVLCGVNFEAGFDVARALVPLFQVAFLIGVMQIGGRYKAWNRLR